MAVVVYTKQKKPISRPRSRTRIKTARQYRLLFFHRIAPLFLMCAGVILLTSVLFPILFGLTNPTSLQADAVEDTGLPQTVVKVEKKEYLLPTPHPTPVIVAEELDYTDLSNWFPDTMLPVIEPKQEKKYMLSIPAVDIEDAEVVYGGKSLDQNLLQYPGTSNPGDFGSPVIFGHSVLRQFYNPAKSNPRRYISIFSKIMTLKNGDEIYITDDGIRYTYKVVNKTQVKPTDRFILEQQRDARQLKLVTCVPEGTYLYRGVVTAVLSQVGE